MPPNSLDDLIASAFGDRPEKKKTIRKYSHQTISKRIFLKEAEAESLIIALNYAINSIKNKKDVKEKRINSTRYIHFQRWTKIQNKLKEKTK